jgi:hypothetical protein
MNDKHKIQVYIMDSNGEIPETQNNEANNAASASVEPLPIQTPSLPAETTNSVVINENLIHHSPALPKTSNTKPNYSQNHHQQIRNFINTSSYLSRQLNNSNSNTTVRINPLLLKRHGLLQNQTNIQKVGAISINEQHMNAYQEQPQTQVIYSQNSYDGTRNNVQIEYPNRFYSVSDLNEGNMVELGHQTNNYQN